MSISKETIYGIISVIGGILIHFSYGHFYTIGNLAPYMTSYIKHRVDPEFNPGSAVWMSAIGLAMQGVSMTIGGALLPKIGYRAIVIIGSLINSGSVLLTYFTIQKGFIYVLLTYATTLGLGFGFSYAVIFSVAVSWFPERRGLIVGFIVGGFGLGALVFTPIQTAYINPNNVAVNTSTNDFTDPDLLDRVPSTFLLLGGTLAAIQFIGIILLRQKPSPVKSEDEEENQEAKNELKPLTNEKVDREPKRLSGAGDRMQEVDRVPPLVDPSSRLSRVSKTIDPASFPRRRSGVGESMHSVLVSHTSFTQAMDEEDQARRLLVAPPVEVNYSPLQALKRHEFYLLWLIMFCCIIPITLITASFKLVAQGKITDDRYLSGVATASSLFNSGGRIMWGAICDQFSFKVPLCIMLTIWATFLFTFPHIVAFESGVMYLYAIWVCVLFLSFSGTFVIMPAATGRVFGPLYMAVNYGLVFSAFSAGSIICAVISQLLLGAYVTLYTICGCTCLVALFLTLWLDDAYIPPKLKCCQLLSGLCQKMQPRV